MGVNLWGASPLYETGSLKEDHHAKWIIRLTEVRGEGNCGAATIRGEEAGAKTCEATYRNVRAPTRSVGRAGLPRRVGHASQSRSQKGSKVNGELVQGQFTLLSGEG
jgi:hypothetical protein